MEQKRYEAIEARLAAMEERLSNLENSKLPRDDDRYERLIKKYPSGMDKTRAAQELRVTRQTVYAMIEDGRLSTTGMGRIDTGSVAELLSVGLRKKRNRK